MAINDAFVLSTLGSQPVVTAVNDLPCRAQVAAKAIHFDAAHPGVVAADYAAVPVKAGSLVKKAWVLVKNACTATSTVTLGYSYIVPATGVDTLGSATAFDASTVDVATIQSISVPAVVAGTLEATDAAAVGVYFPVDGYITFTPGTANIVAGDIVIACEFLDLADVTGDPQVSGATTRA